MPRGREEREREREKEHTEKETEEWGDMGVQINISHLE